LQDFAWAAIEARPGRLVRKSCRRCGSYPRDRIVFLLLRTLAEEVAPRKLRVLEVGCSRASYWWKRRLYDFRNADVRWGYPATRDLTIDGGIVARAPASGSVAILSYVLSVVEDRSVRVRILRELYRLTIDAGRLILFDDVVPSAGAHKRVEADQYFHGLRLGSPLIEEMREAGWRPVIIELPTASRTLAELETPFMLAAKSQLEGALRAWADRSVGTGRS
jgi:hypothetical protein